MKLKTILPALAAAFFAMSLIASCKKSSSEAPMHSISAISPDNGPFTSIVTISGSGFGNNAAAVQVKFNGMNATISSVADNKIVTQVPSKAGTGPVAVTVNGREVTGPVFNYTWITSVSTLAGSVQGNIDGTGVNARFNSPWGVAVNGHGDIFVGDYNNHRIRKITTSGMVTTFAGSLSGYQDGNQTAAKFNLPAGVAVDANGNILVADADNNRIRKISASGLVTTLAGSTLGSDDGNITNAKFFRPTGIAVDANGNIYVADYGNDRIRKISPSGIVSTLAGSSAGYADGTGVDAKFHSPNDVAVDASGNILVADAHNNRIRKITPSGIVTTLAGSTQGVADGNGTNARFNGPLGIAIDAAGNILVADTYNSLIRKITPSGMVTTLAGSTFGFADGGGTNALFSFPVGIATDAAGNIFVADRDNQRIRKIVLE